LSLAHWRWIFRFLACMACVSAVLGWLLMPRAVRARSPTTSRGCKSTLEMLKQFDFVGVILIMAALLLFSLALTSKFPSSLRNDLPSHIPHPLLRCNRLWLAVGEVHCPIHCQHGTSAAFLSLGSDAGRSLCHGPGSDHEAAEVSCPLLHGVCQHSLTIYTSSSSY
jgi:MFS family permease